jgi:hypothetical protein
VHLQVAGQQGAYVARMINRGYSMGVGGMDTAPPVKVDPALGEVRHEGRRGRGRGAAEGMPVFVCLCSLSRHLCRLFALGGCSDNAAAFHSPSRECGT